VVANGFAWGLQKVLLNPKAEFHAEMWTRGEKYKFKKQKGFCFHTPRDNFFRFISELMLSWHQRLVCYEKKPARLPGLVFQH
jgi:hypothetical protein